MAAKKKKVKKKAARKGPRDDSEALHAEFMADLLAGTISPVQLYESTDANGRPVLEFDEEEDDN